LPVIDTNNSIAGELFKIQEEEMGRIQRTHSFIQNFKNLMDDQQKSALKYSNQNMHTSDTQNRCKNKIIEMIIERYLKEHQIDKEKWCNLLKEFTHRASECVKPHNFMLDSEIDVKIICNEWGCHTDSR
jgi:mannose-6-phosphate isomerase class I